jgi:hypothetical protein
MEFNGEKGKSLFHMPLPLVQYQVDWNAEVPEFLQRIVKSADDRSSTVLSAIVVEYHLDRILSLIMQGFDRLSRDHDLGFAMKVDLLKALNLFPEHLLSYAIVIGKTRNKFAHSLSVDSLDQLDQDAKNLIKSTYYAISSRKKDPEKSLGDILREMVQITVMGIRSYESNVRLLVEIIRSPGFLEQLEGTYRRKFNAMLEKLRKVTEGRKGISAVRFGESGEPVLVPPPQENTSEPEVEGAQ